MRSRLRPFHDHVLVEFLIPHYYCWGFWLVSLMLLLLLLTLHGQEVLWLYLHDGLLNGLTPLVGLGRLLLIDDLSSREVVLHHYLIIKLLALLISEWHPSLLIESDLDPSRDHLLDGHGRYITYRCMMLDVCVLHNFMTLMVRHGIHCAGTICKWGPLVLWSGTLLVRVFRPSPR